MFSAGSNFQLSDRAIQTVNTLGTKEARQTWERVFNQHYIQPVLTNLDKNLAIAMDLVANDDQQGLFFYLNHIPCIQTVEIVI